jgi:serine/threonine-protein kinase Chk2
LVNDDTVCRKYCGTPLYLAPEVVPSVLRRPYTEAVDVWSIRVMLFLMLSGYNPFDQSNHSASDSLSTSDYIARGSFITKCIFHYFKLLYNFCLGNFWLNNKWNSVSLDGKTLVKQMLQIDQKDRPKLKDILSSIWMTDSHVITKVNKIVFAATDTIHH